MFVWIGGGCQQAGAAFSVKNVYSIAMFDGRCFPHSDPRSVRSTVLLGKLFNSSRSPCQSNCLFAIELCDIFIQYLGTIPARIKRDKQDAYPVFAIAQHAHDAGKTSQGNWALRVAMGI